MKAPLNYKADTEGNRERIKELLMSTGKKGIEKLIAWLETKDFFFAPGSTQYHSNYPGGLAEHSLNVYKTFVKLKEDYNLEVSDKKIIITSLLHDMCKINFYQQTFKKVCKTKKLPNGKSKDEWLPYDIYKVEDECPLGHGEKSVILAQSFIHLDMEEIMMIRWHMGMFDAESYQTKQAINKAYELYPAAKHLHLADNIASTMLEFKIETNPLQTQR